jgi:hypothetical protein
VTSRELVGVQLGACVLALAAGGVIAQGQGPLALGLVLGLAGMVLLVKLADSPAPALLALTLVIVVFPVARVVVGAAPIYAIDVLAVVGLVALLRRPVSLTPFGWVVIAYLAAWVPAWAYQVWSLHLIEAPTYGLIRNALAVSMFFLAYACAIRPGFWERWTSVLALGVSTTGVLALLQAAQVGGVQDLLGVASPDFTSTALRTYPERAFALFAAPTILAGFFAMAILLLLPVADRQARARGVPWLALMLAALGALATYSRQWVPALAVGLIVLCALRLRAIGRIVIVSALGALVAWAFLAGGALDRSYLEQRFQSLGSTDLNVRIRVERQQEFVALALDRPSEYVVGKGFAGQDIVSRELVSSEIATELRQGLSDNVFLLEVFNHGIVAGLIYVGLMVAALTRILQAARRGGPHAAKLAAVGGALAAALVLHALDNYFSEAVFMKTFLWIVVGLGLGLVERQSREES